MIKRKVENEKYRKNIGGKRGKPWFSKDMHVSKSWHSVLLQFSREVHVTRKGRDRLNNSRLNTGYFPLFLAATCVCSNIYCYSIFVFVLRLPQAILILCSPASKIKLWNWNKKEVMQNALPTIAWIICKLILWASGFAKCFFLSFFLFFSFIMLSIAGGESGYISVK